MMMTMSKVAPAKIAQILKRGDIGVLPTDTIYGLVGRADLPKTVRRIYRVRRRNPKKPMIILIGSTNDLARFGVTLDGKTRAMLEKLWPGKVSAILPCPDKRFAYLHRGTKTLAFRLPKPLWLRRLLQKTGPLVSPSANWEEFPFATTIARAQRYFGDTVDFYLNHGRVTSLPSTLLSLQGGKILVLRQGEKKIPTQ